MSTTTLSLGGGLSDTANQSTSFTSSTDMLSNVLIASSGTYVSGGYDSLGVPYNLRPITIFDISVRVGKNGTQTVLVRPQISALANGISSVPGTTTYSTAGLGPGDTITISTQSGFKYNAFVGNNYYYGFEGTGSFAGTSILYANGGTSGSIYKDGIGGVSSSTKLSGSITYDSIPNAPTNLALTGAATDTTATISWTAPTDDGGDNSVITGYRINYKVIGAAIPRWSVLVGNTGSTATSRQLTGLAPSTNYEVEVAALNTVTDSFNSGNLTYPNISAHVGVTSSALNFTTAQSTHNLRVFADGTYKKATIKIWDGSQWIGYPNINIKVWDGTQFKDSALEL